jgi:DNA repair exonuclease SbcCD ATPase subunit
MYRCSNNRFVSRKARQGTPKLDFMIRPKQKRKSGSREMDDEGIAIEKSGNLEEDMDSLFKLPLAEFTGARNELAARLKREGRADDSSLVKKLPKPSISAWAVNQLHWNHREAFDRLLATGQRFRQSQTGHTAARMVDLRGSLDARREALSQLSDLATELLREAGHNPTPDTIHRITTTLEALSAHATLSGGPTPGRLTEDVDPPSFASLASLIPGTDTTKRNEEPTTVTASQKSGSAATKTRQATPTGDVQKVSEDEEPRRAKIAAAKASLQEARRSLTEAQRRAQRSEAAQKKAHAEAKKAASEASQADAETRQAEKRLRDAEQRFNKASAASQDAAHRAERISTETKEAAQGVEDAERAVEKVSKELELLLQE